MFKNLYYQIKKIELWIAVACLVISVTIIFSSAILRTIGSPINWAIDISLLLFTWSIFLGADLAYEKGQLVVVDLVTGIFPEKFRILLQIISFIIITVFLSALVYYGAILSIKTWDRSFQGVPSISYTWVTISIPISAALMFITTILKIKDIYINNLIKFRR